MLGVKERERHRERKGQEEIFFLKEMSLRSSL